MLSVVFVNKPLGELKMMGKSSILTERMRQYVLPAAKIAQIRSALPDCMQYQNWSLAFDINHDGVSFYTFFHKVARYNPTLVLIQDTANNVFGIYASQHWHSAKEFYGTGECFVFSFKVRFAK